MSVNIRKIVAKWDANMPIASQLTGGMFLVGRGFDIDIPSLRSRAWLSDDARKILHHLEPLITQASEAPDSQHVLKIAEEVLKRIEDVLKDEPVKKAGARRKYLTRRRTA